MKRRHVIAFLMLAIIVPGICVAEDTDLKAADRAALQNAAQFHMLHSTADLPPAIVALCADSKGRLANPGQDWQETDVISLENLPYNRLIWAAVSQEYYVVHYEVGGYGQSFRILVVKLGDHGQKPVVVWRRLSVAQLKDYPAFIDALRHGKLFEHW